jgi:hypothetical protein
MVRGRFRWGRIAATYARSGSIGAAAMALPMGRGTVLCNRPGTGTIAYFKFSILPGGRKQLWRRTDANPCTISVGLTGRGILNVTLRGY